jgi:ATP-dependent DNA helicase RecG
MDDLSSVLTRLATLIGQGRFEDLESDTLEFKPCPSSTQDWTERYKSVNAFLNTRGGILVLGIKETGQGAERKYEVSGYDASAEAKLYEMRKIFTLEDGVPLDATEYLPPTEIQFFMEKRIAIQRVDELPADRKFAFLKRIAYKRQLTGDHAIKDGELTRHKEFLEEIAQATELQEIKNAGLEQVNIDRLNEYILQINKLQKIETLKPSLEDAVTFLERKRFLINTQLTLLGGLVCGAYPGDLLGFRAHVHGYVNTNSTSTIVQDKQDLVDNVLPLLEQANAYVLRNIHTGISVSQGGTVQPQYPEAVLRETINNAIAHRDYGINKQIVIAITPGQCIEISNPGRFKQQLLISCPATPHTNSVSLLRVVPETKPRNPKLADVLRVYRKWEGRGIGMSTLVSLSLENQLNLPYFKFKSDEVTLVLQAGLLVDERIIEIFESRDAYIAKKLGSFEQLTPEKKAVLAYLIKSEWANQEGKFCILLTADNNHVQAIKSLENAGLISRDARSPDLYPIYLADRYLLSDDFATELRERFGENFDKLELLWRKVLAVIYRYNNFSSRQLASANQTSFALWASEGRSQTDIHAFDSFKRNIRRIFVRLESQGFIEQVPDSRAKGYVLTKRLKKNIQQTLF